MIVSRQGMRGKSLASRTDLAHLQYFLWSACPVTVWFLLVYGGCDWFTSQHSYRVPLAMDWEQHIPFLPASVLGYMSLYPLFMLVPFVLRERQELRSFRRALMILITIAGIAFLLLPGEPREEPLQFRSWKFLIAVADTINLTYNFAPSLHVGLSVACVAAMAPRTRRLVSLLLWCWALVIALSTLLLHQHYVIDVLSGWLLALGCVRICLDRVAGTQQLAEDSSPELSPLRIQDESASKL